jgi:hypothetical protein
MVFPQQVSDILCLVALGLTFWLGVVVFATVLS